MNPRNHSLDRAAKDGAMTGDINVLHHVGIIAADIAAVVSRYELFGFSFTPLSQHRIALTPGSEPVLFGTGNRCAIFRNNYLELVGVVDQRRWAHIPPQARGPFDPEARLALYEGLHIMHFGTDDLERVRARYAAQGIAASDVVRLQREVETEQGPRTMRAQSLHFPPGANPEALIQIAQHLTPELVLQPRSMHHRNGAETITEAIVCALDSGALAAKYAAYTGHDAERRDAHWVVDLGASRVVVVDPQDLETILPDAIPPVLPWLAGFTVAVARLDPARRVLEDAAVPFREHDGRLIVAPRDACGSAVLFETAGASR
jgi:hypothetical protein